jgi:hypothetical protein
MRRTYRKKVTEQHDPRGIYSQVIGKPAEETETTIADSVPIDPGPQMSTQLSTARPPVEDETYMPVSNSELVTAASAVAEDVPSSQVEWYYKQIKKALVAAKDRVDTEVVDLQDEPGPNDAIEESKVRSHVRSMLFKLIKEQMISDKDKEEFDEYRTGAPSEVDYFGEDPLPPSLDTGDGIGLEDLAARYGYSGASGIRQEINRLTNRMEYFATKVQTEDLDALMDFAAGEYVTAMGQAELLDPEDVADLRSSPRAVKSLDSFRFFFVSGFVLPAYKRVSKDARDNVMSEIEALGIPKEVQQTVYNQVSGATRRKPQLINKKLMALVKAGKLKQDDVPKIQDKIRNSAALLQTMGDLSDDLVQRALDNWQGMSKGRKKALLKKAMEQTIGYTEKDK